MLIGFKDNNGLCAALRVAQALRIRIFRHTSQALVFVHNTQARGFVPALLLAGIEIALIVRSDYKGKVVN